MSRSRLLMIAAAVVLAAQLVPVPRTNPPVESRMPAPPEVQAILDRSCADCHSHETRWPWYAYVAPVSWLVAYDTHEAREHLNLSTFGSYSAKRQRNKTKEIWEEVEEGEMPLWFYVLAHPEAKLSEADRETLRLFSEARASELEGGGRPGGG
jgi:Haem-binding domain